MCCFFSSVFLLSRPYEGGDLDRHLQYLFSFRSIVLGNFRLLTSFSRFILFYSAVHLFPFPPNLMQQRKLSHLAEKNSSNENTFWRILFTKVVDTVHAWDSGVRTYRPKLYYAMSRCQSSVSQSLAAAQM